jgi:hypothetical protein
MHSIFEYFSLEPIDEREVGEGEGACVRERERERETLSLPFFFVFLASGVLEPSLSYLAY